MDNDLLTDEQIKNWSKILFHSLGPYAFIMSKEEVQKIRNKMQNELGE